MVKFKGVAVALGIWVAFRKGLAMTVKIGLVGLPNVGQTTTFNALARMNAPVGKYPFSTIGPCVAVIAVPDGRLRDIAGMVQPKLCVKPSRRPEPLLWPSDRAISRASEALPTGWRGLFQVLLAYVKADRAP